MKKLCSHCKRRPALRGLVHCERCREVQHRGKIKYREKRRKLGAHLCSTCRLLPPEPNRSQCGRCKGYVAKRIARFKAAGLCRCGREPLPGTKTCAVCLARIHAARAKRAKEGKCDQCCVADRLPGSPYCAACREFHLNRLMVATHGMSRADYAAMVAVQKNCCAICGRGPIGTTKTGRLCVDHDHATGKVRGLLCAACNGALGLFNDDPAWCRAAAAYLEHWKAPKQVG